MVFEEKLTVLGVSMELFAAIFPDEAGKKADVAIEATMVRAGEFQAGKIRLEQGISIFFFSLNVLTSLNFLKGEGEVHQRAPNSLELVKQQGEE